MKRSVAAIAATLILAGCGSGEDESSAPTSTTAWSSRSLPAATLPTTTTSTQPTVAAPNQPRGLITEATWTDGEWPFTVADGVVQCAAERVAFTANRTMYALNGAARSAGLDDVAPIWKDDPSTGAKVGLGPVIAFGLTLC